MSYFYRKVVNIPLYRGCIVIIFTNDIDKLNNYLHKHLDYNFDGELYARSICGNYNGTEGNYIILNFDDADRNIYHGIIAHEAFHIANFVASDRGIIADHNNDEALAYLIEWITDEVYKFINKHDFTVK